jgi:hypothetical protein
MMGVESAEFSCCADSSLSRVMEGEHRAWAFDAPPVRRMKMKKDRVVMAVFPRAPKPEEIGPNGEWPVYESFVTEADLRAQERSWAKTHYLKRIIAIPTGLARFQAAMKTLLRAELRARGL